MPGFQTFECANCEGQFTAYPDANAAEMNACSPACESALRSE